MSEDRIFLTKGAQYAHSYTNEALGRAEVAAAWLRQAPDNPQALESFINYSKMAAVNYEMAQNVMDAVLVVMDDIGYWGPNDERQWHASVMVTKCPALQGAKSRVQVDYEDAQRIGIRPGMNHRGLHLSAVVLATGDRDLFKVLEWVSCV